MPLVRRGHEVVELSTGSKRLTVIPLNPSLEEEVRLRN
jgi:hypothetical protein